MVFPANWTREQILDALKGNVHTTHDKLNALKETLDLDQRNWLIDVLNACSRRCYKQGYIDSMTIFAHWKDGTQFVGTTGTILKDAVKNVNKNVFYSGHHNPDLVNWVTDPDLAALTDEKKMV